MACGTGMLATFDEQYVAAPCILVLASDFGCKQHYIIILRTTIRTQ